MEFHKTLYLTLSTPQRNALSYGNSHKIVFRWQCWRVSHCNTQTHKHELWIWFTLSYAMMRALLRLAAVWDTKQTGELRGDTVQFIASSSALVLPTQNGNIYQLLTQTATCPLPRYRSKHIAENSHWISQTTNRSQQYWRKERASKVPRGRKYMHRKASRKTHSTNGVNIESRVT